MTRWYVLRGDEGEILAVSRIREEPGATHPEVWNGMTWEHYPPVMSYLVDPLAAEEVDEATALDGVRQIEARRQG